MRTSNQSAARGPRLRVRRLAAGLIAMGLFVAACGATAVSPTPPPTPVPTPVVTPNPHMSDPASADAVFKAIARAKLGIVANNAAAGTDPVKQINATYHGWPMQISEYKSAASLAKATHWIADDPLKRGEPAVAIIGLNILIEWGVTSDARPPTLDAAQIAAMDQFLRMIDPYLGPLTVRSSTPLDVPAASASPSPKASPSSSASTKPSAKPSPKATKKPKASP